MSCVSNETQIEIKLHELVEAPISYASLEDVYSLSSSFLCCVSSVGSRSLMSKKVKAQKLPMIEQFEVEGSDVSASVDCCRSDDYNLQTQRPEVVRVYNRRCKRPRREYILDPAVAVKTESVELDEISCSEEKKKRKIGDCRLVKLDVDSNGLRSCKNKDAFSGNKQNGSSRRKKNQDKVSIASGSAKRWVRLSYDGVDPKSFIGLQCKVYWPLDSDSYEGSIDRYSLERKRHIVKYGDGFEEDVVLECEMIRFWVSREEMELLHLKLCTNDVTVGGRDYDEMVVLAATLEGCQDFEPGDIVWAKLAGHPMWPSVVVDESIIGERKGLTNKVSGGGSLLVQFFGTHDFARIKVKQATSFIKGLLSQCHLKCKQPRFEEGIHEAKMYLKEHRLPGKMIQLQKGADSNYSERTGTEEGSSNSGGDHYNDGEVWLRPTELVQGLPKSRVSSNVSRSRYSLGRHQDHQGHPTGYRPVRVDWKDLDKCNVCYMDEEYESNLFLQCDKCRMMVHAKCYGELEEPCDGALWLCNLCRPSAPDIPPRCCLCPVVGGAMKPTTDGRWAHLACAIWIPETCLSDVKKMEPIDGVKKVSKDRWKLLCTICGVSYGACIQCSNNSCRVAYHPLCGRAAGLCVELEDEDRVVLVSMEDEEADSCIRMLSFCKRHRKTSTACLESEDRIKTFTKTSEYLPPLNPSGCARTEPYNCKGRRGRKEPEALAAASSKRLFVENQPYVIGGYSRHDFSSYECIHGSKLSQMNIPSNILSMAEKYRYMKETYRKRLAFGKSGIHGFGIFAKLPHKAGDMVIEYTGELVRPPIADKREQLIYNSMVGAGTYMFRIDDERVIDATRAGSIAHLINHSCVPNCYSRVISVNGDEHIIIFAKRDIPKWEELTYDYRFFSIGERLSCSCGFPGCRGVVNDTEAEEQQSKICVPRRDLIEWKKE
ncbi:histone H3-lysine(4) N-trimethyltransferase ATX1 [Cardamine amara subsp. amara]|uniref:Histone H3-lysine(4) N-trimethyltransferase ATX1 n=1 Tax=Cardamine amara subsp. amara TaxID=228776 RepID=A0ABD1BFF0_CARAN